MSTTSSTFGALPSSRTDSLLNIMAIWRGLFAALTIAAALLLWINPTLLSERSTWQRISISTLLVILGGVSLLGLRSILRRQHRGRTFSLLLDYLGLIICVLGFLQVTGSFLFVDALADTFPRGLPFLGLVLVGYLVSSFGDRFQDYRQQQVLIYRIGNTLMAIAGVLFLVAVNSHLGFLYLLQQLANPSDLLLLLGVILFGLALWIMWRKPSAVAMNAQTQHERMLSGWLFLSPNLLGFTIFLAGPLLLSLYFSFTDSDAFNPPNWVGLDNYAKIINVSIQPLSSPTQLASEVLDVKIYDEVGRFNLFGLLGSGFIFGAADKLFWLALRNTLFYAIIAVPLSVIPALLLANVLNSKMPGMRFFRALYFLPSIAAIVGISLVWQWLYNATIGYINYIISIGADLAGVTDPKIQWLSDKSTAMLAVIIMSAWQNIGFNTVLFMAGLQNIPKVLYEAATVDGADRWQQFRNVTIPMLAPTTFYVLTTASIQALQMFEQVFILMNPPEGPDNSTVTLVSYLYRSGFQNFRQGYASAVAWVLFLVIFGLTVTQFRRQQKSASTFEG